MNPTRSTYILSTVPVTAGVALLALPRIESQVAWIVRLTIAGVLVVAAVVQLVTLRSRHRGGKPVDYQELLDRVPDAVWVERVDPRRIIYANSAFERLFTVKREDCYRDPDAWLSVVGDQHRSSDLELWRTAGEIHPEQRELELALPDERRRWVTVEQIPVRREANRVVEAVSIATDTTELKSAMSSMEQNRAQLIQAEKLASLGTLVAGIAHEINNPDHTIMATSAILEEAWKDLGPILDEYVEDSGEITIAGTGYSDFRESMPLYLDGLLRASERIRDIVAHLRDFARQDVYDVSDTIEVNAVTEAAIELMKSHIQKRTSRFVYAPGVNLPQINGNSQRLQQVVINLIRNACQALTSDRESVSVRTSLDAKSKHVQILVSDEGGGIPPDELSRVFDPFYTTHRTSGGMGLGLSVSKGIVDDHGGSLTLTSDPGRGTTVTVSLPIAE